MQLSTTPFCLPVLPIRACANWASLLARSTVAFGQPWHPVNRGIRSTVASGQPWHPVNRGIRSTVASGQPWHPVNRGIRSTVASGQPWHSVNRGTGCFHHFATDGQLTLATVPDRHLGSTPVRPTGAANQRLSFKSACQQCLHQAFQQCQLDAGLWQMPHHHYCKQWKPATVAFPDCLSAMPQGLSAITQGLSALPTRSRGKSGSFTFAELW